MVESKKDLGSLIKVDKTRDLCKKNFPFYKRMENNPLQDSFDCFKYEGRIIMAIHYTEKSMVIYNKNIKGEIVEKFSSEYKKIWQTDYFKIELKSS